MKSSAESIHINHRLPNKSPTCVVNGFFDSSATGVDRNANDVRIQNCDVKVFDNFFIGTFGNVVPPMVARNIFQSNTHV